MLPIALIIDAIAIVGALFALWKGGAAERRVALIVVANILAGWLWNRFVPGQDSVFRPINDGVTALFLLGVTIRYASPWMGGVMLLYGLQFGLHSYYMVTGRKPGDYLHALINNVNFLAIVACLMLGTLFAWIRRARTAGAAA